MKLFLYYAAHTFKNQLKKLFKSWIVVFILACALFGGIIGFASARIGTMAERRASEQRDQEILAEETAENALSGETEEETAAAETDGEDYSVSFSFSFLQGLDKMAVFELAMGLVILLILVLQALSAESSGAKIFLPADVNLLFSSPMKPQGVLLFRLVTKMGLMLALTLYMFLQLPNLTLNLGLSVPGAVSVIAAWGFLLIFATLLQTFLYVRTATREKNKSVISTAVYAVLGAVALGFLIFYLKSGMSVVQALAAFFNAPAGRMIPVWGWLKGFCLSAAEGNYMMMLLYLGLFLAACAVLLVIIARMKADFYEDAMAKSEETAELQREARENGITLKRRKKDRSEKLRRDGLNRGFGANIFFFKTVYNRSRFAVLGYFTKTTFLYFALSLAAALLLLFMKPELPFEAFTIVALLCALVAFYRSLGNPLDQDVKVDYFRMIPESSFKKLMFSLLGGSWNCLLDLLPGLLLAAFILQAPVLTVPGWIVFIVSMDAYSTTVASFLEISIPKNTGRTIRQFAQILFFYFGLGPAAILIAAGAALGFLPLALLLATLLNLAFTALFIFLSAVCIAPGHGK